MTDVVYVVQVCDGRPNGGNWVVGVTRTAEDARSLAEQDAAATVGRNEVVCIGGKEWRASRGYDFDDGEERAAKWDVLYLWEGYPLD